MIKKQFKVFPRVLNGLVFFKMDEQTIFATANANFFKQMSKLLKHFSKSIKKENKQFHILNRKSVSVCSLMEGHISSLKFCTAFNRSIPDIHCQ